MYCNNCGMKINDNAKFCSNCGKNIDNINKIDDENINIMEDRVFFSFKRHKSLGRIDISHFISDINIEGSKLRLNQQKIRLYFWKKQPIETEHDISEFAAINIKRTLDLSDVIFSTIFFMGGFVNPALFLGAVLLLWIGIGYNVNIIKNNGLVIRIPMENHSSGLELVKCITDINKSIAVEQ